MKKSSLLRVLCVLVTSVVLIGTPESSFAAGGHGGGVEDSTAVAAASTAVASGGIAEAGVELAGVAVMAGTEAGVGTAGVAGVTQVGDAAGVGVIPVGVGELVSALVGAGAPIGRFTRMRTAILIITPIIRITHIVGGTRMRQWTRIGIAVATEIRVTTRSSKIRGIQGRRDRLA
jgi:hypothetical protein